MSRFTLHHGDSREVLKTLAEASVDSIVTDPPYGIRFMGQAWDGADIEAGGRAVVRERLGVSKQTLSDWKRAGRVPPKHAPNLEVLSGIPREKLCPDDDRHQWVKRGKRAA